MLIELRIENLGIIEEVQLVVGRAHRDHRRDRRGQDARHRARSSCSPARGPTPRWCGPGAAEARVEGRFEDPLTGEEVVVARVVPADGRSRAYIDGRLATVDRARGPRRAADRPARPARAPEPARAGDAARGPRHVRRTARARAARGVPGGARRAARRSTPSSTPRRRRPGAGPRDLAARVPDRRDRRRRARRPRRGREARAEEDALADAAEDREALLAAHDAVDGRAVDAVGVATAALAAREPLAGAHRAGARAAGRAGRGRPRPAGRGARPWSTIPERLEAVRERRRLLRDLERKYGETSPRCSSTATRPRRGSTSWTATRRARAELEADRQRVPRRSRRRPRPRLHARAAEAAGHARRRGRRSGCGASRCRARSSTSWSRRPSRGRTAPTGGRSCSPRTRASRPSRWPRSRRAASCPGRCSALRVALAERGGRGRGPVLVFDEVDAGIGGEAGAAVGRELAALARERPGTVHHPPRPGRRRARSPGRGPQGGARRPHRPRRERC